MHFFDLRGIFLTQIATEKGKYELSASNVAYPTYSEAALDKMLLDYMNEQGYNVDKLGAYKKLGTESYKIGQEWYEQVICKKVEINSVSELKKMYADLINIWNNMKFVFEVIVTDVNQEFEVASDYLDYIEYHIDWGDGAVANTSLDSISHPYTEIGTYLVTVTINKIKDYQNDALTSSTELPFYINCNGLSAKCVFANYWAPYAIFKADNTSSVYIASPISNYNGLFTGLGKLAEQTENIKTIQYGDSRLPYFNPQDGIGNYTAPTNGLQEVYIQTIGTDFTEAQNEYAGLKILKVAPDDLNTFKTAVTAFNNGNTTATLTVLKGKNQEEAYQWATANGHFASIVKE